MFVVAILAPDETLGFIIGKLMDAPEVYDPEGLSLMVDDFCLADEDDWDDIGDKLINEISRIAKTRGAKQILVVCGAHDIRKKQFLKQEGLKVASEWHVGGIR